MEKGVHLTREDRDDKEVRRTEIIPDYLKNPLGSVLISCGDTKVICTAMIEDSVPPWMAYDDDNNEGWLTSRYGMLPGSGDSRIQRETRGVRGRTKEIQRIIGRSLRAALDMEKLGPRTVWIDCDVIQADGGTRTASVTGAWVALKLALSKLIEAGDLDEDPIIKQVAAVSVGLVDGKVLTDLCYKEDSSAEVDMNVAMDIDGNYIEVQATGEAGVFSREQLDEMLDAASEGISQLLEVQNSALEFSKD